MTEHRLKISTDYFIRTKRGNKTAELRYDDRDYMVGDSVVLCEWKSRKKEFSGREIHKKISHITWIGQWIKVDPKDGAWCILHLRDE